MIWMLLLLAPALAQTPPERGAKVFAQSCAVGYCHGSEGAASRGPRLRGRTFSRDYVLQVTRNGIPNTAMPGWKDRLPEADIAAVVDYIASISTLTSGAGSPPPAAATAAPSAVSDFDGPPEARRGRSLFFEAVKGVRCGTCHEIGGLGQAVGPSLARAGKSADELARFVREGSGTGVVTAVLAGGERFPALVAERDARQVRLFDLTAPYPVLRSFEPAQVQALEPSAQWRHAAVVAHYSDAEIDAIVAYLRWLRSDP